MTARDLLDLITMRDAEDSLTRAIGWTVSAYHIDFPEAKLLYGFFEDPAPALVSAAEQEAELNEEGETGFRCVVVPVMPS